MNAKNLTKGAVWYTDNQLDEKIMLACQKQLLKSLKEENIISVSLKPVKFGRVNIVLNGERGWHTMFKQILAGLLLLDTDIAFLTDHDVLYHPTHFDFTPPSDNYFYNQNIWRVRVADGFALYYDCFTGCCANRELLIKHYQERLRQIEETLSKGERVHYSLTGLEAGTHNRKERIDDIKAKIWRSEFPNIDIRHKGNNTASRWSKKEFVSQSSMQGWKESTVDQIPGWENLKGLIESFQ